MTRILTRRDFAIAGLQAMAVVKLAGAAGAKSRVGLVQSTHRRLARTAGAGEELDYELVRQMVWQAIDYGRTANGTLAEKIKPGSWVLIKPNIVYLKSQRPYRTGDVTDQRVTRAVFEYVARYSKAARITLAEGGSYRTLSDPTDDNVVTQNGQRADAFTYDWGGNEFPGAGGTMHKMLTDLAAEFPDKQFDYVDLSYDYVRDSSGKPLRIEVPTRNGMESFSNQKRYFVTNAIRNCDFLISVPVAKVHEQCGFTACFKNYVGTAPRAIYCAPGRFWNVNLHGDHSVDNRLDPFIADLAAFHPPDYNVVDAIRGLQYTEHNNERQDQMLRNNIVLAGEDTVAVDSVVARLLGFQPVDIDYLHMGAARGLGTFDLNQIDVVGDELDRLSGSWAKARRWYARCNREWLVTGNPESPKQTWQRHTSFGDYLYFADAVSTPAPVYAAAATVRAEGSRKGFLWMGLRGKAEVRLNGRQILEQESITSFRVGQVQHPVELAPGENQIEIRVTPLGGNPAQLAAVVVGPSNNGDSLEGARWSA